jgi:hypothetical protein
MNGLTPFVIKDESPYVRGIVTMGHGRSYVERKDAYGNTFTDSIIEDVFYTGENQVVIGGNQYIMCKIANLPYETVNENFKNPISNINPGKLSDGNQMNFDSKVTAPNESEFGVNISPLHYIQAFTIGYGGALESNIHERDTNYKGRMLYKPIPFRFTSQERTSSELMKYGGVRTSVNNGVSSKAYYLKRLDDGVVIRHLWRNNAGEDGTPVTKSIFDTTDDNGIDIESYIEFNLTIDRYDAREYFQNFVSGENPIINELGLVAAYWDSRTNEFLDPYMITHITFPNYPLQSKSLGMDTVFIKYRLYFK